jgi:hypothetical protein
MMGVGHNGTRALQAGHDIIITYRMCTNSCGQIGRVADNKTAQKVAVSEENLAGLSNGIQSPCILAGFPTSMNYDREPNPVYHQPDNLMEVVAW